MSSQSDRFYEKYNKHPKTGLMNYCWNGKSRATVREYELALTYDDTEGTSILLVGDNRLLFVHYIIGHDSSKIKQFLSHVAVAFDEPDLIPADQDMDWFSARHGWDNPRWEVTEDGLVYDDKYQISWRDGAFLLDDLLAVGTPPLMKFPATQDLVEYLDMRKIPRPSKSVLNLLRSA